MRFNVLNVDAKNPNDGTGGYKKSDATLQNFKWRLFLDDKETISGDIDQPVVVPGTGDVTTIPLRINIDLMKFFKDEFVRDEKVLEHVRNIFRSRNMNMPLVNEDQALVPKNSKVIWNANGTAPGIWIEKDNRIFIAMPGVPYEMKAMTENPTYVETVISEPLTLLSNKPYKVPTIPARTIPIVSASKRVNQALPAPNFSAQLPK